MSVDPNAWLAGVSVTADTVELDPISQFPTVVMSTFAGVH